MYYLNSLTLVPILYVQGINTYIEPYVVTYKYFLS